MMALKEMTIAMAINDGAEGDDDSDGNCDDGDGNCDSDDDAHDDGAEGDDDSDGNCGYNDLCSDDAHDDGAEGDDETIAMAIVIAMIGAVMMLMMMALKEMTIAMATVIAMIGAIMMHMMMALMDIFRWNFVSSTGNAHTLWIQPRRGGTSDA
jgi:hypothetical protein